VASKLLNKKLTALYQCLQKPHADAQKKRRAGKVSVEGGLKELLADDDPRKPEDPIVEYVCSASMMA
jgi:hypothetical protein